MTEIDLGEGEIIVSRGSQGRENLDKTIHTRVCSAVKRMSNPRVMDRDDAESVYLNLEQCSRCSGTSGSKSHNPRRVLNAIEDYIDSQD